MFSILVNTLTSFFATALIALTLQNAVLVRGFEMSRLLSLVEDTRTTAIFGAQLTLVTAMSCMLNYGVNHLILDGIELPTILSPLVFILCTALSFAVVFVFSIKFFPEGLIKDATSVLPIASFNCVVIGMLQYTAISGFTFIETLGYAIGASLGYIAAVFLVSEGGKKLHGPTMPRAFRGLPAVLLYLAGLVLALYGLTGMIAAV